LKYVQSSKSNGAKTKEWLEEACLHDTQVSTITIDNPSTLHIIPSNYPSTTTAVIVVTIVRVTAIVVTIIVVVVVDTKVVVNI
jgi:hypothetical protein